MVPTRPLGKTGERISILGFGTAPSGNRKVTPRSSSFSKTFASFRPIMLTSFSYIVSVSNKMDFKTVFGRRGCYETMMKAKTSGLARFIGFSGHNRPARFVKALRNFQVDVLLNAVNFVDRHTYNFEETVWPLASRLKMGLIAMKVFGGEDKSKNIKLSHSIMSAEYHDLAFRYALSIPGIASTAIGMATRFELHQNIKRAKTFKPITPLETNRLKIIGPHLT